MSPCTCPELNDPIAGAVNPVPLIAAMLACVIGLVNGVLINDGIPATCGSPLTMAKITVSSTPAVPRSNRLSANLAAADVVLVIL